MTVSEIQDLFISSKTQGVIVTDITLQVTQKAGKLLVEEINKEYFLFINVEYVIADKNLFIQLPNGRSLTLKIV
jgi:hypothetical protein